MFSFLISAGCKCNILICSSGVGPGEELQLADICFGHRLLTIKTSFTSWAYLCWTVCSLRDLRVLPLLLSYHSQFLLCCPLKPASWSDNWPMSCSLKKTVTALAEHCIVIVEIFYVLQRTDRSLTWIHFGSKKKDAAVARDCYWFSRGCWELQQLRSKLLLLWARSKPVLDVIYPTLYLVHIEICISGEVLTNGRVNISQSTVKCSATQTDHYCH